MKGEYFRALSKSPSPPSTDEDEYGHSPQSPSTSNFGQFLANKPFELLTKEEKSLLPFHVLAKKKAEYQRGLIAKLPIYYPGLSGCRKLTEEYEYLNDISEGTYGMVFRAQNKKTDEIVALKLLKLDVKLDEENEGFPITALREINMLLKCGKHENIVNVREIVVDDSNIENWSVCLVMEFVENDLKMMMDKMRGESRKWTIAQIKTLMRQLLSGIGHLHEEFVLHRDLKTANLLLSKGGILKIGDFGMAREFGDPLKQYTPLVCTLWYRAPEILLGTKFYSTPADIWSVGCIFGEFLQMFPMFPGKSEIEQMRKIFHLLDIPNEECWPGCGELPGMKQTEFGQIQSEEKLESKFWEELAEDNDGMELLIGLLKLDPMQRISAIDALKSEWFQNDPIPADPSSLQQMFPSKGENANKRKKHQKGAQIGQQNSSVADGFSLKFDVPKF